MKYSKTMTPPEWDEFCSELDATAKYKLMQWLAHDIVDATKTPLGIQMFRKDWTKEGKYMLLTRDGEEFFKKLDPFGD